MSTKTILALGAIAIMIFAIGCSNGGRTTAPGNNIESLNLPNNNNVNRFSGPAPVQEVISDLNDTTLIGIYNIDALKCISLDVVKYGKIELTFSNASTIPLKNGMLIQVIGRMVPGPGTRCQYGKYFIVNGVRVIKTPIHTLEGNTTD